VALVKCQLTNILNLFSTDCIAGVAGTRQGNILRRSALCCSVNSINALVGEWSPWRKFEVESANVSQKGGIRNENKLKNKISELR